MMTNNNNTDSTTNTTSLSTIELIIWFEGRETDNYVPFDPETSEEGDIKINKGLIKPLMYFGSVLGSDFGKLKMPKGIEIVDGSEAIYEPDLNLMTALMRFNFETVRNEINSDSLVQAFKTWNNEAPYYLIGVSCKNTILPCPDKCREALKFDGVECDDWFLYVRDGEPRPQFPLSAWKYNRPKIQVNETGLAWSKRYDQVTGGFKAFTARKKGLTPALRKTATDAIKRLHNKDGNDGYPVMTNLPKGNVTEEEHMTVYSFGGIPINHGIASDKKADK